MHSEFRVLMEWKDPRRNIQMRIYGTVLMLFSVLFGHLSFSSRDI